MKNFHEWPPVLFRKWLLTGLIGTSCLVIGLMMFLVTADSVLLSISILLAIFTAVRCTFLYRLIGHGHYAVVDGTCIQIKKAPLHKQRSLCLLTDSGEEHTVTLDQRLTVCVGHHYRLYYCAEPSNHLHKDSPALLHTQQFLALEDLGDCSSTDP